MWLSDSVTCSNAKRGPTHTVKGPVIRICCVTCLQVAAAAGCHAVATSNPPAAAAKEPVLAEGAGGPIHVKQQSRSQVTPNLAVQQAPSTTQPPGAAVAAAAASGTPPVLAAANLPITAAAGAPAAAAPGAELEWGPGPTAQNLAAYEAELQVWGLRVPA